MQLQPIRWLVTLHRIVYGVYVCINNLLDLFPSPFTLSTSSPWFQLRHVRYKNMARFIIAQDVAQLLPKMQVVIVVAFGLDKSGTNAEVNKFAEV